MAVDLSVFRKQRKLLEKKRKKSSDILKVSVMKEEKVISEIRSLEGRIMEDMVLKKDLEKQMKETRRIMYLVLGVCMAIFGFLIGVLIKYLGK